MNAERDRLNEVPRGRSPWRRWGPYLSERAWGTVREDYSAGGDAWEYFPFEHAHSRAYRWNEDGLAGICDDRQTLCFALALWNGQDRVLKERLFGLSGPQGNHGEDVKECWWYLDCTPTHSWMRWRYMYPQTEFPYERLISENAARGREQPEFELIDTGVFDEGRYWEVTCDYAKAGPDDLLIRITVRNAGPERAMLDLLPTLWFRNTWSWDVAKLKPSIALRDGGLVAVHEELGTFRLDSSGEPEPLFCDNETNAHLLFGPNIAQSTPYPKDGIGDYVISGAPTVSPDLRGTKAAFHHRLTIAEGASATVQLRLREAGTDGRAVGMSARSAGIGHDFGPVMAAREREADQFYADLAPGGISDEERAIMRQALAGMLWSKQFYHYDVRRWLEGDPAGSPPPPERWEGRNHEWLHLNNRDVISMPDKWEYPWYAAWDLAFHCVTLAYVDPEFAKSQLIMMCREWFAHPNGQLPAYEWNFSDVNPPVHAWAALRVYEIAGDEDQEFLERILHKLLLNFTWWVNRKDAGGNNLFSGGFLGLDNIGAFDRDRLPVDGKLEQSDGSAWMAMYCQDLLGIALELARHDRVYEDLATKFFEHFALIAAAINDQGLWDEASGFYYDVLHFDGQSMPLRARSCVGLLPLAAVTTIGPETMAALPDFAKRLQWFVTHDPAGRRSVEHAESPVHAGWRILSVVDEAKLRRLLGAMLDPDEFLSDHGLRALSRRHAREPLVVTIGDTTETLDYEPGESTTPLFGGNSNWRGPVWFPINYLLIRTLRAYHQFLGDEFTVPMPTATSTRVTLAEAADALSDRLISIFRRRDDGTRPVFGEDRLAQTDPAWREQLWFYEYFHGDTGAGLGASHQTGWTGLVANLILERGRGPADLPDPASASLEDAPPGSP
ncbi:MAG: MGH1-like glycoside hydrolase domain-containing protein [Solirubrobacteraceae bacterium]